MATRDYTEDRRRHIRYNDLRKTDQQNSYYHRVNHFFWTWEMLAFSLNAVVTSEKSKSRYNDAKDDSSLQGFLAQN